MAEGRNRVVQSRTEPPIQPSSSNKSSERPCGQRKGVEAADLVGHRRRFGARSSEARRCKTQTQIRTRTQTLLHSLELNAQTRAVLRSVSIRAKRAGAGRRLWGGGRGAAAGARLVGQ